MASLHELLEESVQQARRVNARVFFDNCRTAYIQRNEAGEVTHLWVSSRPDEHDVDGFKYVDISNNMEIKRLIAKNAFNHVIYERIPEGVIDIRLDYTLISDLKSIAL